MSEKSDIYADWNPWHGCTKISPGCKYCYVYRQDEMYGAAEASSVCRRTGNFDLPVKRKRGGDVSAYEVGLDTEESGVILPCGNSGTVIF